MKHKNVTVTTEQEEKRIKEIQFPNADCFYIIWEDEAITKYRYNFVKTSIPKRK